WLRDRRACGRPVQVFGPMSAFGVYLPSHGYGRDVFDPMQTWVTQADCSATNEIHRRAISVRNLRRLRHRLGADVDRHAGERVLGAADRHVPSRRAVVTGGP